MQKSASTTEALPRDLEPRHVLLGVSSSIAVYKALDLVSHLVKRGAQVQVILTPEAALIVQPIAFETLSQRRVVTSLWERPHAYEMEHLEWTKWADLMVVVPATANVIGKIAHGIADDALTTAALAWPGPMILAPAMNPTMWANPVLQENVQRLRERGYDLVGPASGPTACGDVGEGRMAAVEEILAAVVGRLKALPAKAAAKEPRGPGRKSPLSGKRVLVTSGPTREHFDPVRYLSNPSSGKMGHALAAEAARRGASVVLVHGPVSIPRPEGIGDVVAVTTAREMCDAVVQQALKADVAIFAAAVSDWRPAECLPKKAKKETGGERMSVELVRNPDGALASLKVMRPGAVRVGFAAETHDHLANARAKYRAKKFDLLVVNDVLRRDSGFASDQNEAWLLRKGADPRPLGRMPKSDLAKVILDAVETLLSPRSATPRRR